MNRKAFVLLAILFWATPAGARNFQIVGENEICGGIGFAADFNYWTPGGFKWFNDYSRMITHLVWLNFQFNVVAGGDGGCWRDQHGGYHCEDRWGGNAIEFAGGVKLKWRLTKIPLQFHAKVGGIFDILLLWSDYSGVAFGGRGGFGVRYFFLPTFGVGGELVTTLGPAIINHDVGLEFYGAIDFNAGVEWHF